MKIFASYFVPENPERAAEIDAAFLYNRRYHQVIEVEGERPSFNDFFAHINATCEAGELVCIINSDIAVDPVIDAASRYLQPGEVWCLGRWNKSPEGWKPEGRVDAQDAWVFRAPIHLNAPFPQGAPGCDNRLARIIHDSGFKTLNPCNSVPVYHHHSRTSAYTAAKVKGPYHVVRPMALPQMPDAPPQPEEFSMTPTIIRHIDAGTHPCQSMLHIALVTPESPQRALRDALAGISKEYHEIDWHNIMRNGGRKRLLTEILGAISSKEPTHIFMQLQDSAPIGPEEAAAIRAATKAKIVSWCGDVRKTLPEHYVENGVHWNKTLMSNYDDVWELRKRGVNADYLQIGYDQKIYNPSGQYFRTPESGPIVFLGNNYNGEPFDLSSHRREMVMALRREFGRRFIVRGTGWEGTYAASPDDEVTLYKDCAIAVCQNHFQRDGYYSDRMLRALGSGAYVLSHRVPNCIEFTAGTHYDAWTTVEELIAKCHEMLNNRERRLNISAAGLAEARENNTWDARMGSLVNLFATCS